MRVNRTARRFARTIMLSVWVIAAVWTSSTFAQDIGLRIGFVDAERILRESSTAKAAQTALEGEFTKRQKVLEDEATRVRTLHDSLDKSAATLPEAERIMRQREVADLEKDLQRKQRELNEDANLRRNQAYVAIVERINKVIRQVAEAEKLDIVVQEAVYVNPRIDVTDKVLKTLNSQPVALALPNPTPAR